MNKNYGVYREAWSGMLGTVADGDVIDWEGKLLFAPIRNKNNQSPAKTKLLQLS